MKRSQIKLVIAVATLLLMSLVATQIFWVKKAYELEEKQFTYEVTQALISVVDAIQYSNRDTIPILDPVEQVAPNYFRVRIHDTLYPYYLETLLKNEFRTRELNIPFEYSIYDCFNDSIVFQKCISQDSTLATEPDAPIIDWKEDDGHYFSVLFPERDKDLFAKMEFWVYSSVILIGVIGFFWYMIHVILKQRRISEIKTDFINNMTHEFKTPISTIALSSEVLMKEGIEKNPVKLTNYAKIIHQENTRLQSQVERILQIATTEKESIKLKTKQINLHEVVKHVAETFELNAAAKSGHVAIDLKAENPVVKGDEVHLTNIISNLIDNGIKYTEQPPLINIETSNHNKGVLIKVSDNGIGIGKEDQKQVFDQFYRVPKGNVHDVKGFGIGLHYVKVMIEQHNGWVKLKSDPGVGSTFELYIPHNS